MVKKILIAVLCLSILSIAASCEKSDQLTLVDECKQVCQLALNQGRNLSNGPCLLDPMSNSAWVCDIAHTPRQNIDNLLENQCNAYRNGTSTHFIELTPECELIKVV
ncbi:MAG: hypothetical protein QXP53_02555 [Candidatus Pacearchaeota archaeon]